MLDENYLQNQFDEILVKQGNVDKDQLISIKANNKLLQDVTNIVENKTGGNNDLTYEIQVPEVFRKSVFWPKSDLCKVQNRRNRLRMPSVLTSEQGIKYLCDKEENKRKKEEAQEQRK